MQRFQKRTGQQVPWRAVNALQKVIQWPVGTGGKSDDCHWEEYAAIFPVLATLLAVIALGSILAPL